MLDHLEETVRRFVLDVCSVMYNYGFTEVSVGVIMRLMGIPDEQAGQHDNELIVLDETFEKLVKNHAKESRLDYSQESPPAGTTLH